MGNENKIILTIRYTKRPKKSKEIIAETEEIENNKTVVANTTKNEDLGKISIPLPDMSQNTALIKENETVFKKKQEYSSIKNLLIEENKSTPPQLIYDTEKETETIQKDPQIIEVKSESKELDPVLKKTSLFLDEEIKEKTEKNIYSLDDEFEKTKKNRNIFTLIVLVGFIMLLAGITFALTYEIKQKSNQMQLEIKEFEDLNLSEAISKARDTEKKLGSLKEELENSKKNFNSQMDLIRAQTENKMKGILGQKLSEKEKQRLLDELKKQEQQQIYQAKLLHESEMRKREKQINEIQVQLSDYQKKYDAKIKEKDMAFGDERKLFEVQIKKQKEAYETKINNLMEENQKLGKDTKEYRQKLMEEIRVEYETKIKDMKSATSKEIHDLSVDTAKKIQTLQSSSEELKTSLKGLEEKNKLLETENKTLTQELNKKNQALESIQYALNTFAQNKRENGYVLDCRDFSKIIVIINNNYIVKNGDTGVIIDDEDKKVADVEFILESNYTRAVIKGETKGLVIKPFYRLIINLK